MRTSELHVAELLDTTIEHVWSLMNGDAVPEYVIEAVMTELRPTRPEHDALADLSQASEDLMNEILEKGWVTRVNHQPLLTERGARVLMLGNRRFGISSKAPKTKEKAPLHGSRLR